MPRPKSFDIDDVLRRALEIFWEHGFDAVSVQDLAARIGVNKRSLYETYGDKEALYLKALEKYRRDVGGLVSGPLLDEASGRDGLLRWLRILERYLLSPAGRRGCFVTNCVLDVGSRKPEARRLVGQHLAGLERNLRAALDRAGRAGELRQRRGNAGRARLLVSVVEGLFVLSRCGGTGQTIRSTLRETAALIRSW